MITWLTEKLDTLSDRIIKAIMPHIKQVKSDLSDINNSLSNLGTIIGDVEKMSDIPTTDLDGNPVGNGDIVYLTKQDGDNQAGQYKYNGTDWVLMSTGFNVDDILATEPDVDEGTKTKKVPSVKDLKTYYARINGNEEESFKVKDAEENTKQAVNASQFILPTQKEVDAVTLEAWNGVQ